MYLILMKSSHSSDGFRVAYEAMSVIESRVIPVLEKMTSRTQDCLDIGLNTDLSASL